MPVEDYRNVRVAQPASFSTEYIWGEDGLHDDIREDVERYISSRYATQSDGGEELLSLLAPPAAEFVQDNERQPLEEEQGAMISDDGIKSNNLMGGVYQRAIDRRAQAAQLQVTRASYENMIRFAISSS